MYCESVCFTADLTVTIHVHNIIFSTTFCELDVAYFLVQVFHIPIEERRYNFSDPSFGSGSSRQTDIVQEIKEKTGCDIEISQAKDHSLSIMVSGKPSAVINARNEVLAKLQTQVPQHIMFEYTYSVIFLLILRLKLY